jgi:uncharacterized protein YqeY
MLKQQIHADFVVALKAKDEVAKAALSGLKAKITEAEKQKSNQELLDPEVVKVLMSAIKQRKDSAEAFTKGGRLELAEKELAEMAVFEKYMPKQMSAEQIEVEARTIIAEFNGTITNAQALVGRTIGAFNKKFQGQADTAIVKSVIEKIVAA